MDRCLSEMGTRRINNLENTNQASQLTSDQVVSFYRLWFGLLKFANEQYKIVTSMLGKNFHQGIDIGDAGKIGEYIWAHPLVFDKYLQTETLDKNDRAILYSWQKHHYRGKFYIVRYLKDGAVFLSTAKDEKPYLVKGLASAFDDIWPKRDLPTLVETVLLPFEGVITTCGLYYGSRIFFGGNISRDIRESCRQAELTYGLISSLPYLQIISQADKNIARIKLYLQSAKNLESYKPELEDLVSKDPKNYLPVYFYQRGLLEAKNVKREYRKLGLKKFHFALYGSVIIAANPDKQQVEDTVGKLVSKTELERIVYDKV